MKTALSIFAPFYLLAASAGAQTTVWSQSTDNTTIIPGSVSCQNAMGITDNSYWRLYDPVACGLAGDYEISACTFGVELAATTSSSTMITVNIRAANGAWPTGGSADPILGTVTVSVPDTDATMQTFVTAAFAPPIAVPAGTNVAVEVMAPNGMPQGDVFFIGSNNLGETPVGSSHISAADCGLVDPTPLAVVGFPDVHVIIDLAAAPAGPPSCWRFMTSVPPSNPVCILEVTFTMSPSSTVRDFSWVDDPGGSANPGAPTATGSTVRVDWSCGQTLPAGHDVVFDYKADPGVTLTSVTGMWMNANGTITRPLTSPLACPIDVPLGNNYCNPAVPNSTGFPGAIAATGTDKALLNFVELTASDLPPGEFGYFLVSQSQGFFMPAGSQGFICLGSNIGRYNQPANVIQGPTGSIHIDLTALPVNPVQAVLPGETWNFQCWYRDNNPGSTSNFTDAIAILFQ